MFQNLLTAPRSHHCSCLSCSGRGEHVRTRKRIEIYIGEQAYHMKTLDYYLSNRPLFLWVYRRNKPRGMLGELIKIMRLTRQTNHSDWQNESTDSAPDTLQSKATKTFHAKKVLRKERKRLSVKGRKYIM